MLLTALLPLVPVALSSPVQFPFLSSSRPAVSASTSSNLVPLSLGVMSKCPDAAICEALIDRVLDSHTAATGRQVVGDLVDLELLYIARSNASSSESTYDGLVCLHGPSECTANVQQLCAAHYWSSTSSYASLDELDDGEGTDRADKPKGDWKDWWNFVQCMNYGKRDKIGDVSTAKQCAKVVGREWTRELEECSSDSRSSLGTKLFHESVDKVRKLKVEKSCSILLNDRKICVHDGVWKECENGHEVGDIVSQIKAEYKRINNFVESSTPTMEQLEGEGEDTDEDEWVVV
ncbi:hypothetical protein JCM10212_002608 [Sporobolomyces blumeae]